jgi:hypothetical protein
MNVNNQQVLFTVKQGSVYLGMNPDTFRKYVRKWDVPSVELGGSTRYHKDDLDAMIAARRKAS